MEHPMAVGADDYKIGLWVESDWLKLLHELGERDYVVSFYVVAPPGPVSSLKVKPTHHAGRAMKLLRIGCKS